MKQSSYFVSTIILTTVTSLTGVARAQGIPQPPPYQPNGAPPSPTPYPPAAQPAASNVPPPSAQPAASDTPPTPFPTVIPPARLAAPTPPQPAYSPASQSSPLSENGTSNKKGVTFELNLGVGSMMSSADNSTSQTSLAGLSLGVGGFVNRNLAITGRIAGGTYSEDGASITQAFVGPAVQYWATKNLWFGGGIGFGIVRLKTDFGSDSNTDLGFDARAGYSFNPDAIHSFNLSMEFTQSQAPRENISVIGFLAGWQVL